MQIYFAIPNDSYIIRFTLVASSTALKPPPSHILPTQEAVAKLLISTLICQTNEGLYFILLLNRTHNVIHLRIDV